MQKNNTNKQRKKKDNNKQQATTKIMFSGLTNQVTSWMGNAKDEEVPQPGGGGAVPIDEQVDPSLASGAGISAGIEATGENVGAEGEASRFVLIICNKKKTNIRQYDAPFFFMSAKLDLKCKVQTKIENILIENLSISIKASKNDCQTPFQSKQ